MKLGDHKCRKVTEPDFQKKFWFGCFGAKRGSKWVFLSFFVIFLKNGSNDFVHIVHIDGWDDSPSFCKNRMSRKNLVLEIWGKTCPPYPIPHVTMVEIGPKI